MRGGAQFFVVLDAQNLATTGSGVEECFFSRFGTVPARCRWWSNADGIGRGRECSPKAIWGRRCWFWTHRDLATTGSALPEVVLGVHRRRQRPDLREREYIGATTVCDDLDEVVVMHKGAHMDDREKQEVSCGSRELTHPCTRLYKQTHPWSVLRPLSRVTTLNQICCNKQT